MTINAPAAIILAFYVVAAEENGSAPEELGGHDPDRHPQGVHRPEGVVLPARAGDAAGHRHGRVVRRRDAALEPDLDLRLPHPRGRLDRAQELAFTLKDGFTYVERAVERGLDVDAFAPRLCFFFNAHIDFFEEIAKYRAARRIWATELRDTYGAKDPRSLLMRFHTQTAGVSLTAQQPQVNIVRTAIEALAGGARRDAVAAHQLLRRDAGAADRGGGEDRPAHPAGDRPRDRGHEHRRSARRLLLRRGADRRDGGGRDAYFARIDELGGMVEAIKTGFPQREIADAAFQYQREIETEQRRSSASTTTGSTRTRSARSSGSIPAAEARSSTGSSGTGGPATKRRSRRRWASSTGGREPATNLMPALIAAARVRASEGEIVAALQEVFGTYTEHPQF